MTQCRSAPRSKASRLLLAVLLGAACSPPAPPQDANSAPSESETPSESEAPPSEPEPWNSDPAPSETSDVSAPPAEAPAAAVTEPPAAEPESPSEKMVEFFEIGRGDRVADLGGVSGYSLIPVRRAVGPTGAVYVRRRTPPPEDPAAAASSNGLGPIVWMNTPDEAPFIPDATRLNAVTLLFSYPSVSVPSRKKLNAAVYRALAPGGLYIIAGHAASPDTEAGAARRPTAVPDSVVRADVEAAGFQYVEGADFVSSNARAGDVAPSRYVLKFRKPH